MIWICLECPFITNKRSHVRRHEINCAGHLMDAQDDDEQEIMEDDLGILKHKFIYYLGDISNS